MSPSCRRIPLGHKPPDVITPPGTKYPAQPAHTTEYCITGGHFPQWEVSFFMRQFKRRRIHGPPSLFFLYSRRSLKRSTENSIPAFPLSRSDTPVSQAQRRPTLPQQLPRPGASRLIIALPPCVHGRSSHPPCSKRNGRRCGGYRHFPPTLLPGRAAERPSKPKPIEEPVRRSDARALDKRTPLKYAKICVRKPM